MKYIHLIKAKENEEVIKQRLEELARLLDEEGSISYGEINYLQNHKEEVKKYFPNNSTMWQWADITEEEWKDKQSSKKVMSKVVQVNVNNIDWYWDDMEDEDLKAVKSLPKTYKKLNVEVEDALDDDEIYNNIAYELKNVYGYIPRDYDYVVIK